jgi:type II secretory pathway component PulC
MHSKKILVLGSLAVMALAFWIMTSMVFTWVSQRRVADFLGKDVLGPLQSRSAVPRHASSLTDYAAISGKNIFYSESVGLKMAAREEAAIQVTERNLQLKGTVVGEGPKSYAIIVDHNSSKEGIYFQDDFIVGVRIARILRNRVILDSNGEEEALLMTDETRSLPELGSASGPGPPP